MPICICCSRWGNHQICQHCRRLLQPAPVSEVAVGFRVYSGYVHETVARRLVHLLKYDGLRPAAKVLATAMAAAMPSDVATLIPVPRAMLRRVRYGVDPAVVLAAAVGAETGIPVARALKASLWWPSHAGQRRRDRQVPRFRLSEPVVPGSALVDDVLTTGATLQAASEATGLHIGLTATRAGRGSAR